jgi:hypothetical protein
MLYNPIDRGENMVSWSLEAMGLLDG